MIFQRTYQYDEWTKWSSMLPAFIEDFQAHCIYILNFLQANKHPLSQFDFTTSIDPKETSRVTKINSFKQKDPSGDQPELIIVMGGVCTGKTTFRKSKYSNGYVCIDAGEIFIELSKGEYYDFPSHLEEKMNQIGIEKMRKSILERKNIVIEIIGCEYEMLNEVIALCEQINYSNKVVNLKCDKAEAWQRNVNRENDNISAYFCEPYHVMWLKQAVIEHIALNY